MIRRGTQWMVVGVCVVAMMAAAAWAQPRGERDRPERRPEVRRDDDRPRPPRREAPPRRPEREERPRREPPRERHEPGPPKIMVFRLKHISAGSFMEVLEQLARCEMAREMLRKIPVAANPEANAIVVVGPPEVGEFFERLAHELDHPSEFHALMRERDMEHKRQELELRAQMHRMAGPHAPGVPGGPEEMEMMRRRKEEMKEQMMRRRQEMEERMHREGPPGEGFRPEDVIRKTVGRLLSPPVMEKVRLDADQVAQIREMVGGLARELEELHADAKRKVETAEPERRPDVVRDVRAHVRERIEGRLRELRERIGRVLRPEQREMLKRILGPRPGGPREEDRPRHVPDRRGERDRPDRERQREREEEHHRPERDR